MVQQTIPQFAVFDFPPSENPIETFELVSEVAKWLQVPNQTVYAAVKRGDETKGTGGKGRRTGSRVKNKEGKVFLLKKLGAESGVECSAPEISFPSLPQPPAAVPPPQVSPKPPSTPPEVAEVIRAGKTFSFETSKKIEPTTFLSAAKVARFIKSGCGKLFLQGPKKHQMFICNDKRVHLPDLVREIIVFHIRDQMWKDEDGAAGSAFFNGVVEYNLAKTDKTTKNWIQAGFLARIRKLDDETIEQICKEFMKMV